MPAPTTSNIAAGTILVGKYRVLRELGRGGMAAVYEAEHLSLRKKVAVKVLAAELTSSKVVSERFFREARAAASVKSPHIVDVYDSGRIEDGRPFIVMELLEGESLYDRMARERLMSLTDTVRIIVDCAKGLMKAHSASIVHRDLKPENIFLLRGEDGVEYSKILDFGLAKFYAPMAGGEQQARLTREGAVFGTPAYMSPEQVNGVSTVDHRADLWALGCMAYECVTGRPVWNMDNGVAMTFAAIATEPLPVPSSFNPAMPRAFDAWFRRALERDPNKRFQSAKELADALEAVLRASADDTDVFPSQAQHTPEPVEVAPSPGTLNERSALPALPVQAAMAPPAPPSSLGALPSSTPLSAAVPSSVAPAPSAGRLLLATGLLVGAVGLLAVLYAKALSPQIAMPVVEAPPPPASTVAAGSRPQPSAESQGWEASLGAGQRAFAAGDLSQAQSLFRQAEGEGAGTVAKGLLAQARAAAEGQGTCRVAALGRPRRVASGNSGRPSLALRGDSLVVVWSDEHEQAGREHAYALELDAAGVALGQAVDVTPEATSVMRPSLLANDDHIALFYWDKAGREAGVWGRLLGEQAEIAGEALQISAARPGHYWASFLAVPGGFVASWQDDGDGTSDLMMRRISRNLDTQGPEVRITDYVGRAGKAPVVRTPAMALSGTQVLTAFRLDRGKERQLQRARIELSELDKPGLAEDADGKRVERVLGDVKQLLRADKMADAPSVACGKQGCFAAWQEEPLGVMVAFMEPKDGKRLWYKQVAAKGARPSVATGREGDVMLAYYEAGRVRMAQLSRAGAGPATTLLRAASSEVPKPSMLAGREAGEWFLAWLDAEGARFEPYVARVLCPR